MYRITLNDVRVVRRHVDHIRSRECTNPPVEVETSFDDVVPVSCKDDTTEHPTSEIVTVPLRRSTRISHPPSRLIEDITN